MRFYLACVLAFFFGCGPSDAEITVETSVTPEGGGAVLIEPQQDAYLPGDKIRVTAQPTEGYTFIRYGGSIVSASASTTITLSRDVTIEATFQGEVVELLRTSVPEEGGSISLSPGGELHRGDVVKVTARPAPGYSFVSWEGSAEGTKTSTDLTLTGEDEVIANFEKTSASAILQVVNDLPSDGDWSMMNTLVRLRVGEESSDLDDDTNELLTAGESSCEPTSIAPGKSKSFEVGSIKPAYFVFAQTGLWEYDPFFGTCYDLYITSIHDCGGDCCTDKAATTQITGHTSGTRVLKLSTLLPAHTWEDSPLCSE